MLPGDDWINTNQKKYRDEVIDLLKGWNGELIEVEYSKNINELQIKEQMTKLGITTSARLGRLRKLLAAKPTIKILEVHNALSGLIAENAYEVLDSGEKVDFDGMWSSSLTDSTSKGKPDIEAVDTTARLNTVNEIFEVTTKPMIYDADTGGKPEHFEFTVRSLERTGVSAVIIEDKTGLKRILFFGNEVKQTQDSIENFCHKIRVGKQAPVTFRIMPIGPEIRNPVNFWKSPGNWGRNGPFKKKAFWLMVKTPEPGWGPSSSFSGGKTLGGIFGSLC